MKIQFWARTDVGRKRSHNEDNFLVDKKLNLYVVCDGMGGHASGEIASATAVKEVHEKISANRDIIEKYSRGEDGVDTEDIHTLLEHAVQYACFKIYDIGQKDKKKRGMGTTLSLLLIAGKKGFYAHVGDSRIYLIRDADVTQVTRDHSLLNELIERGKIKSEKDIKFPFKNAVTRAVGVFETVDVDTETLEIEEGDYVLLCSDGLHGYFEEISELRKLLAETNPDAWVDRLVDSANEQGGKDNITAVMVKLLTPAEAEVYETRQRKVETLKLIPLFKYLTQGELDRVIEVTNQEEFEPDTVLFSEGDEGDSLYVVLSGQVEIRKGDVVLASLSTGLHFGEMSLIDKVPRSAEARAITKVETLRFTRERFFDLLRNDSTLAVKLLWSFVRTLSARLRSTSDELAMVRAIHSDGALERIAPVGDVLISDSDDEGNLPPTPPQIGMMLGDADELDDAEMVADDELEADDVEMPGDAALVGEIAAVLTDSGPPSPPDAHELDPFSVPDQTPPAGIETLSAMVRPQRLQTEEIHISELIEEEADGPLEAFSQLVAEEDRGGELEPVEDDTVPVGTDALSALTELVEQERQSVDDSMEELVVDPRLKDTIPTPMRRTARISEVVAVDDDAGTVDDEAIAAPNLSLAGDRPLAGGANDATVPDLAPPILTIAEEEEVPDIELDDETPVLDPPAHTITMPGNGLGAFDESRPPPSVPVFGNSLTSTAPGARSRKRRAGSSTLPYIFVEDLEKPAEGNDANETVKEQE